MLKWSYKWASANNANKSYGNSHLAGQRPIQVCNYPNHIVCICARSGAVRALFQPDINQVANHKAKKTSSLRPLDIDALCRPARSTNGNKINSERHTLTHWQLSSARESQRAPELQNWLLLLGDRHPAPENGSAACPIEQFLLLIELINYAFELFGENGSYLGGYK